MKDKLDQLCEFLKLQERICIFDDHRAEATILSDGSIVVEMIDDIGEKMDSEATVIEHDGDELYVVYKSGEHEKLSVLVGELEKKLAENEGG